MRAGTAGEGRLVGGCRRGPAVSAGAGRAGRASALHEASVRAQIRRRPAGPAPIGGCRRWPVGGRSTSARSSGWPVGAGSWPRPACRRECGWDCQRVKHRRRQGGRSHPHLHPTPCRRMKYADAGGMLAGGRLAPGSWRVLTLIHSFGEFWFWFPISIFVFFFFIMPIKKENKNEI